MINIKDQVYRELSAVLDNVSDIYPSNWASLPALQYTEEENNVYEYADDQEVSSFVRYRIDIWDNKSTSATAVKVDEVLSKFGLKRTSCMDVADPSGMRHKMMRYEAIYDVNQKFIYHRN